MTDLCPCCGQELPKRTSQADVKFLGKSPRKGKYLVYAALVNGKTIHMSEQKYNILKLLYDEGDVSASHLDATIWPDETANGIEVSGRRVVVITHLREILRVQRTGVTISPYGRGVYRLVAEFRRPQEEAA